MPSTTPRPPGNLILSRLPPADLDSLLPHLQRVELPLRKRLETKNRTIPYVYFVDSGIVSVVVGTMGHASVEVGIVGREGITGGCVVMGVDRSPYETFVQAPGEARRITVVELRKALQTNAELRRLLLRYVYSFSVHVAFTALANGRAKLEERLARWLLMAHDRLDCDEMPFTHEFLALMLGVRRPGVTVALKLLEQAGLIHTQRSVILVLDRDGLIDIANGIYGVPETELRRMTD